MADSRLHTDGIVLPCAQATEAAINMGSGPLSAWDIPDSLRLGHEQSEEVAMRRALCGTPLNTRLTFARDGSVRIQVGSGPRVLTPYPKQCRRQCLTSAGFSGLYPSHVAVLDLLAIQGI